MKKQSEPLIRALTCHVQITGVRARVDGSLGISLGTPELSAQEKAVFMGWMNHDLVMLLEASSGLGEVQEVKTDLSRKSPSQRLRATLFRLWQHLAEKDDFEIFYLHQMNTLISHVQSKIE